jgi:anthranilate phosphoribosyltransferase
VTTPQTWPAVLSALLERHDLPAETTAWAMGEIMSGSATPVQIAGFVVALRAKGETVDEVEGLVQAMYDHATHISIPGQAVDVVGTGGDRAHTVNISTMAALVAAGAGARVVKHGNRAASSACGAADLLEELGVRLDLPPARVAEIADEVGITFCFAPVFHPALRHAAVTRRELGVPTTFNFLGPLANPAKPTAQAVGVADGRMAGIVAGVLAGRGVTALVFRGDDGLDELTTTTTSRVWLVRDGQVREERLDPADLGVAAAPPDALRGGDAPRNADVARRFLAGEKGPIRDAVLLNAAAALAAYDGVKGALVDLLPPAMDRAADAVDTGAAADVLDRWVAACTG